MSAKNVVTSLSYFVNTNTRGTFLSAKYLKKLSSAIWIGRSSVKEMQYLCHIRISETTAFQAWVDSPDTVQLLCEGRLVATIFYEPLYISQRVVFTSFKATRIVDD